MRQKPTLYSTVSIQPSHNMTTRGKTCIYKRSTRYSLIEFALLSYNVPTKSKCIKDALYHLGWLHAIKEEIYALHQNKTWTLISRSNDMNVIGCKWAYKTKLKADGTYCANFIELASARIYYRID